MRDHLGLGTGLGLLALVCLLTATRYRPPAPLGAEAPPETFSAHRARDQLAVQLAEGVPHRAGSPENQRVRRRLEDRLRQLGYAPMVQARFSCGRKGTCTPVENLLARTHEDRPLVLLVAHYDSATVSPGGSDDGLGVAVLLELARLVARAPPARLGVAFLFADAEEGGLLGSQAFVDHHPWRQHVALVINVDGRGSSGPSLVYETSGGSLALARAMAGHLRRPISTSLFQPVSDRMPTDSDFTPFREAGVPGFNLAQIEKVWNYHSPRDTLANLDLGSLQHHGENALALVRAAEQMRLPLAQGPHAVYFDVFGRLLVRWPAPWSPALSILLALLWMGLAWRLVHAGVLGRGAPRAGWMLVPGLGAGCLLGGGLLGFVLVRTGITPSWFLIRPLPGLVAYLGLAGGVFLLVAAGVRARSARLLVWYCLWTWWVAAAVLLGLLAPAASYLFLVPAAVATLAGHALLGSRKAPGREELVVLLPALAAAILWVPTTWLQFHGIGFAFKVPLMLLAAVSLAPLAPLVPPGAAGRRLARAPALLVLVALGWGGSTPAYDAEAPQRASLVHHQDLDSGRARWLVEGFSGPVPGGLGQALDFGPTRVRPFPWSTFMHLSWEAPAESWDAPRPLWQVLEVAPLSGGGRRLRARLASPRQAAMLGVLLEPAVRLTAARMNGEEARPSGAGAYDWGRGWQALVCLQTPAEGLELELELAPGSDLAGIVYEFSPGVGPPQLAELVAQRPPEAMQSHYGDGAARTFRLPRLMPGTW